MARPIADLEAVAAGRLDLAVVAVCGPRPPSVVLYHVASGSSPIGPQER